MFRKILCAKKPKPSLSRSNAPAPAENQSSALKFIHAGGIVEHYYMATPAARIMDKYPAFILARPDVFKRPWESIVKRDEILIPGHKYYVVPKQTVKKLRRRIKRHGGIIGTNVSFVSQSSNDGAVNSKVLESTVKAKKSRTNKTRRVRFFGIHAKKNENSDSDSASSECIKGGAKDNERPSLDGRRRAARHTSATWQPSLTVISETFGHD